MLAGDELEFAISQYLDGCLALRECAMLEEQLATDATAREALREYEQITAALRTPLPPIDWDHLLRETQQKTASHWLVTNTYLTSARRRAGRYLTPRQTVFGAPRRWLAPLALAASILIAVSGITLFVAHSRPAATPVSVSVTGPQIEQSSGQALVQVSIGAAPSVASKTYLSTDDIVDRPSIVLIDRADKVPDSDALY